jgi:hypothetical protein
MMAAGIVASQHFNNAWTPRGEWAASANRIRNMCLLPDRIRRREFKGASLTECADADPSKNRVPIVKTFKGRHSLGARQLSGVVEERINTMSELATALYGEEVLHGEVPDVALEVAGSKLWEGPAASFTLSFCTGLDTCPTSPRE